MFEYKCFGWPCIWLVFNLSDSCVEVKKDNFTSYFVTIKKHPNPPTLEIQDLLEDILQMFSDRIFQNILVRRSFEVISFERCGFFLKRPAPITQARYHYGLPALASYVVKSLRCRNVNANLSVTNRLPVFFLHRCVNWAVTFT